MCGVCGGEGEGGGDQEEGGRGREKVFVGHCHQACQASSTPFGPGLSKCAKSLQRFGIKCLKSRRSAWNNGKMLLGRVIGQSLLENGTAPLHSTPPPLHCPTPVSMSSHFHSPPPPPTHLAMLSASAVWLEVGAHKACKVFLFPSSFSVLPFCLPFSFFHFSIFPPVSFCFPNNFSFYFCYFIGIYIYIMLYIYIGIFIFILYIKKDFG